MRTIIAATLALGTLAGIAGTAFAQDDPSPNNTRKFYDTLDREGRGGQGGN
jgi:hypothetical protein